MSVDREPMVKAEAVAKVLGMSRSWVLREAQNDRLPHYRLGNTVRFRISEIEAWAAARRSGIAVAS